MSTKGRPVLIRSMDPDIHRRLRIHCAETGQTMAQVIAAALESYLSKPTKTQKRRSL